MCSDCREELRNRTTCGSSDRPMELFLCWHDLQLCSKHAPDWLFSFLCFFFQMMVSLWFVRPVTRESLNPKPYSFGNPGSTWNSRSASPKLLKVPRRQINSFTFFPFFFLRLYKDKDESLNVSNSRRPSTIASTNLLWPRGRDLSACWLQTDTWKGNAVREASAWWQHRPKTPSGKAVKFPHAPADQALSPLTSLELWSGLVHSLCPPHC